MLLGIYSAHNREWNFVRDRDDMSIKDGTMTGQGRRRASCPGPRPSHEEFGSSLSARAMPSAESPLCKAFHSVRAAGSSNSTPSYPRTPTLAAMSTSRTMPLLRRISFLAAFPHFRKNVAISVLF